MVLQDACDEALHVQNLLGHKLEALEREHELMVSQFASESRDLLHRDLSRW